MNVVCREQNNNDMWDSEKYREKLKCTTIIAYQLNRIKLRGTC